jgi:hypothetical protein
MDMETAGSLDMNGIPFPREAAALSLPLPGGVFTTVDRGLEA